MTDNDALRQVILDDPDDAPRLVYADWLEAHGGEQDRARAVFIRAQVRAAAARREDGVPGEDAAGHPCPPDLDDVTRRLWGQYRVAWLGPARATWPSTERPG